MAFQLPHQPDTRFLCAFQLGNVRLDQGGMHDPTLPIPHRTGAQQYDPTSAFPIGYHQLFTP